MKELFFIRHGESQANALDILAGRRDYELTEEGRKQAREIAENFLKVHSPDLVISSPLVRARQTAQPFMELSGAPLLIKDELIEQELGIFAGKTYSELEKEPLYCHDRSARWDWVPPGGESYRMVAERVAPLFSWIESSPHSRILMVTHAVTMRLLRATLEGTLPQYPHDIAKNGEVWRVEFHNRNETCRIESKMYCDFQPEHRA